MKKWSKLWMVSLVLTFFSCEEKMPTPTMPEDQLINILVDVHFAEAAMNSVYGSVKDSLALTYYNQIYAIHKIDSSYFQEQISALRKNPPYMKELYEKVLRFANEKEATLKTKKK